MSYPYFMILPIEKEEQEVFKKEDEGFIAMRKVSYQEFTVDTLAPELMALLYKRGTDLSLIEKVTFTVVDNKETVCNIFYHSDFTSIFRDSNDYIVTGRSKLNRGEEYNSVIGNTLAFARALDS